LPLEDTVHIDGVDVVYVKSEPVAGAIVAVRLYGATVYTLSVGLKVIVWIASVTVNDRGIGVATAYNVPPTVCCAAFAVIVHGPVVNSVTTPADVTVQTPVVDDV
jgi:hypothetical protein